MRKDFFKRPLLTLTILVVGVSSAVPVQAIPDFYSDSEIQFYDPNACDPNGGSSPSTSTATDGSVYMVGDSITKGADSKLKSKFKAKGLTVAKINGVGSRSLTSPGDGTTNGKQAVEGDKEEVKKASIVIVALGTNSSGDADAFKEQGKDLIDTIKSINSEAKLYWVNLFSTVPHKTSYNSAIDSFSSQSVSTIDTTKASIELADGVHPTSSGYRTYAKTVGDALDSAGGGSTASSSGSGQASSCCPSTTSQDNVAGGSSDAETAFKYFVGEGLSKAGAAGIVGNLMRETGGDTFDFDPKSAPPKSSYYGIAQWSSSRWPGLVDYANGKNPKELDIQLEYILEELKEDAYKSLIPKLKNATDPQQAARDFNTIFEVGAGADQRARNAQKAYDEFKNTAGSSVGSSTQQASATCCGSTSSGSSDIEKFLKVLAYQESGGNPTQPGSAGGARGKYQYIDSTWKSSATTYYQPALSYDQAHKAPEEIQDAVAYLEYTKKFKDFNNDIFKLAVSHFYPVANSDPSKLDVIPPSNVITPRQYANKLINTMKTGGDWEKIPLKYSEAPDFTKWAQRISATDTGGGNVCDEGGADNSGVGNISWPLDKDFYNKNPTSFTSPHHNYPAVDIPVPSGTKVYSMTSGRVIQATTDGNCGVGVFINYGSDVQIGYCHGTPGSHKVKTGDTVRAGQLIMLSDNSGRSFGPHLHIQIKVSGESRCPQSIFQDLANNKEPNIKELPSSGCIGGGI